MSRRLLIRRLRLWLPPLVYMAAIFSLSAQSDPLPQITTRVPDKLLHTTEYAGLGLLVCRALAGEGIGWLTTVILALVMTSTYGATDEWHQSYVPMRSSDIRDWLADDTGAAASVAAYGIFSMALRRRRPLRR